ncbi:CynX/NimT family MFS transporter [Nonomuraea wenchangensis]|uniref:MFS transporter, CP family, cyanate transporter n=1 Tax=Nonomuraea wenchangensis TaxID=568860 RepID=A0A1I0CZY3_9ACTN|nr:MFS transporter [Nonomuraea wenchangensis]SET25437.1 MFS transporter, CP family, cyanate transporter [Nonomuraea wenchangensis]
MSLRSVVLVAGFVLAALNLRPAIAGVSPLLDEIMGDVGLSPAGGGAITTVMVVCLGVFGSVAPLLARRIGLDRTLLAGLLVIACGVALRGLDGAPMLYLGSALAATAIAVMNVSMPGVVKQHFPSRINVMTGVYVSAVVAGAAIASAVVIPVERLTGFNWRGVTALLAVPALLAALLWLPQALRAQPPQPNGPRPFRTVLRSRVTWYVTALMGLQSLTFYVVLAWLPTIFMERGVPAEQAGYLLSLTNLVQVAASLAVPVLAGRRASQVPYVVGAGVLTVLGYLGVLLAPTTLPWLWMIVLGLGQGASFALALLIIALRPADPATVTALSAVAQSVGYVIAALGPLLFGYLRELSGGWDVPLTVALGVLAGQIVVGWFAGRPATLGPGRP